MNWTADRPDQLMDDPYRRDERDCELNLSRRRERRMDVRAKAQEGEAKLVNE